jgi:hypothetical protein
MSYQACSFGQRNGVLAKLYSLETIGEGHVYEFIILSLFRGYGQSEGKECGFCGVSAMAEGAGGFVLHLYAVVADGVFEIDVVELAEVPVQLLEETFDQLGNERGTG